MPDQDLSDIDDLELSAGLDDLNGECDQLEPALPQAAELSHATEEPPTPPEPGLLKDSIQIDDFTSITPCPKRWHTLEQTDNDDRRYCNRCEQPVHLVRNTEDLHRHAQLGHCVLAIRSINFEY